MATCEICERGPAPEQGGVTVYRQNKPGEMPAIWRCEDCRLKPSPEVQDIVNVLEGQ